MGSALPSTAIVVPRRRGSSESLPSSRSRSHLCALCFPTKVSVRSVRRDAASHSLGSCWSDWAGVGGVPLNQLTPPESVGWSCWIQERNAQLTDWFRWLRRARASVRVRACVSVFCFLFVCFFMCRENQTRDFFSRACLSAVSSKCSPGPCN